MVVVAKLGGTSEGTGLIYHISWRTRMNFSRALTVRTNFCGSSFERRTSGRRLYLFLTTIGLLVAVEPFVRTT